MVDHSETMYRTPALSPVESTRGGRQPVADDHPGLVVVHALVEVGGIGHQHGVKVVRSCEEVRPVRAPDRATNRPPQMRLSRPAVSTAVSTAVEPSSRVASTRRVALFA